MGRRVALRWPLILVGLFVLIVALSLGTRFHYAYLPVVAADAAGPTMRDIIDQAAYDEGVDPSLMRCIAWYESRYDPNAVSWSHDEGLFQFHIWPHGSSLIDETPWAGMDPFDPWISSYAAGWLMHRGYLHRWSTWWLCE